MNFNIVTKLSIWLSLLGIFSAALTGYYAYNESRALLIQASEEKLLTANHVLAQRFSYSIELISKQALLLGSLNLLKESTDDTKPFLTQSSGKAMIDIFSKMMSNYPEFSQIRYISADNYGKEIIRIDRTDNGLKIITDNLQEKGHYPYVYQTLKLFSGQVYLSDINYNREYGTHQAEGKPTLRIATPVESSLPSEKSKNIGLIVINVNLNNLFFLLTYKLPKSIQTVLTNQEGDYLIHPDRDKVFGFEKGRRILIQNDIPNLNALYEGSDSQLILNSNVGSEGNNQFVSTFLKVPFGVQTNNRFLVLGLLTPTRRVLEGSIILGHDIIHLIIIFSLLSIIASIFLSRFISMPIQNMALTIRNYGTGKHLDNLPVERKDEIGFLARTFLSISHKIDEHIQILEKNRATLQKSEQQLSEAQSIAKLGSWEWNAMSNKISTSSNLSDIIGQNLYDLQSLYDIIHPDVLPRFKQDFEQAYKYQTPLHITYNVSGQRGYAIYLKILGEIVHDGDGKPVGMIGSIQDVTREQEYIKQLQKLRLEAEKANYSKSEFLANMSHELRTPLHAMLSFAQFGLNTKRNPSPEKMTYYFQMIQSSGERLLELLSGLLDISKLEAGKMEIVCVRTNFLDVMDSCIKEQEGRIQEHELSLQISHSDAHCFAEFDSLRITQVISNLLSNAIKVSAKGDSIALHVECHHCSDPDSNEELLFSIKDQGIGIPVNEIELIFNKFVQSSHANLNKGGTGLGLAISRQIINLHNGKIWAENHPQGGAVFFFCLPLVQDVKVSS